MKADTIEYYRRRRRGILQSYAEKSLREFTSQAWHLIEPSEFVDGNHIGLICEALQAVTAGQIKKLLLNIPPRFSKSLLVCVFWFCWSWIRQPYTRWLFSSYSQQLSKRDSLKCRNIITSQWYQERWGRSFQISDDQNEKHRFENTRTGFRIATSVEGMGVGEGGDYLVTDDPHKTRDVDSEVKRTSVRDWYAGTMMTRGNVASETRRVIVMQRLHEDDLSGWAIEQGDWEHLCLPQEYDPDRRCVITIGNRLIEDWRTEKGQLLCEERFGPEQVAEAKRALGSYWYAGQHQQSPHPADGEMFKREDFRYYRILKLPGDVRTPSEYSSALSFIFELRNGKKTRRWYAWDCWWFQVVDTSEGEGDESAYTALGTYCVTPDNELIVWEVIRERLGFTSQYDFMRNQFNRYDCLEFQAVEKASTGSALIAMAITDGHPFEVLTAYGSKIQRARASQALYTAHRTYHRMPSQGGDWVDAYEGEHVKCPTGKYWDQIDIGAYAAIMVAKKGGTFIREPSKQDDEDVAAAAAEMSKPTPPEREFRTPEDDFDFRKELDELGEGDGD